MFSLPDGLRTLLNIIQAICLHADAPRHEKRFVLCDASPFLAVTDLSPLLLTVEFRSLSVPKHRKQFVVTRAAKAVINRITSSLAASFTFCHVIHLQVVGHEPVPVGASPFLAVTGLFLSLNSAICPIHSSDIFPNKIIGYAIVAAAVNNAAVFIHRNKISPPCFFHSNLNRDSGSCPSVSQYKLLQRVICVFEVRYNVHANGAQRHEPRGVCHRFDQFS